MGPGGCTRNPRKTHLAPRAPVLPPGEHFVWVPLPHRAGSHGPGKALGTSSQFWGPYTELLGETIAERKEECECRVVQWAGSMPGWTPDCCL